MFIPSERYGLGDFLPETEVPVDDVEDGGRKSQVGRQESDVARRLSTVPSERYPVTKVNQPSLQLPTHTLVVPCHNEEGRLRRDAFTGFVRQNPNAHLVMVDDCSTDRTREILDSIAEEGSDRVAVISRNEQTGSKAEAVRLGILEGLSRWDDEWIGFLDADLSAPLAEVPVMFEALDRNPKLEMILGSRVRLFGRSIHRSSLRHYLGRIFATVVSWMFDLPVYDTQCGAKLIRREVAGAICSAPFVSRWFFDVELIDRARRRLGDEAFKGAMEEVPLRTWVDDGGSKIRGSDFVRVPIELIRIKLATRHATSELSE